MAAVALSEGERERIADDTIAGLRRFGQFPFLDEPIQDKPPTPRWSDDQR